MWACLKYFHHGCYPNLDGREMVENLSKLGWLTIGQWDRALSIGLIWLCCHDGWSLVVAMGDLHLDPIFIWLCGTLANYFLNRLDYCGGGPNVALGGDRTHRILMPGSLCNFWLLREQKLQVAKWTPGTQPNWASWAPHKVRIGGIRLRHAWICCT